MSGADFTCGRYLDACQCARTGPVALSPAGMQRRHEQSLARAQRHTAGQYQPTIQDAMDAANDPPRPAETARRPRRAPVTHRRAA